MIQYGQPNPSPREVFDLHVPETAQREIVSVVIAAYQKAVLEAEAMFAEPERRDMVGHMRRGFIEQDLRAAMGRRGLDAVPVLNRPGTQFHTRVSSGAVILTQSAVQTTQARLRDADFRDGYSAYPQLYLLDDGQDDRPLDGVQALYAIVVHAPHPQFAEQPAFIDVVFPLPADCNVFQDRIRLLDRFADLCADFKRIGRDEIQPPTSEPLDDLDAASDDAPEPDEGT